MFVWWSVYGEVFGWWDACVARFLCNETKC